MVLPPLLVYQLLPQTVQKPSYYPAVAGRLKGVHRPLPRWGHHLGLPSPGSPQRSVAPPTLHDCLLRGAAQALHREGEAYSESTAMGQRPWVQDCALPRESKPSKLEWVCGLDESVVESERGDLIGVGCGAALVPVPVMGRVLA